jgi:hypothetical protein
MGITEPSTWRRGNDLPLIYPTRLRLSCTSLFPLGTTYRNGKQCAQESDAVRKSATNEGMTCLVDAERRSVESDAAHHGHRTGGRGDSLLAGPEEFETDVD